MNSQKIHRLLHTLSICFVAQTMLAQQQADSFVFQPVIHNVLPSYTFDDNGYEGKADKLYLAPMLEKQPILAQFSDSKSSLAEVYRALQEDFSYPDLAKLYAMEGKAVFSVTIDEDGEITHFETLITPNKVLSASVEKFVRERFATWTPGYKDGNPVKTKLTLPMQFKLQ